MNVQLMLKASAMPPILFGPPLAYRDPDDASTSPVDTLRSQWTQPTDVFSVLILLGGDLVNKALAQLAGGILTPVTLSFGMPYYIVPSVLGLRANSNLRLGLICRHYTPSKHRR